MEWIYFSVVITALPSPPLNASTHFIHPLVGWDTLPGWEPLGWLKGEMGKEFRKILHQKLFKVVKYDYVYLYMHRKMKN